MIAAGCRSRSLALVVAFIAALAADAAAQFGPGGKKGPNNRPGYWKKNRNTGGGGGSEDVVLPINLHGTFALGNKVKSRLPARGSNLDLDFYALEGSVLDLQITCTGELGESKAVLKKSGAVFGEELKKTGRKFTISDYVVGASGMLRLSFQHQGEGEIGFNLVSDAELPKVLEETLDFSDSATAIVMVDGWSSRRVTEIALIPNPADGFGTIALSVAGPDRKTISKLAPVDLSAARSKLALDRSVALPIEDEYYFQFDLEEDTATAFEWTVKITFQNGSLPSGTVTVDPK
jgi:hypothetical protein